MPTSKPKLVYAGEVPAYCLFSLLETGEEYRRIPRTMLNGEPDVMAFNPGEFITLSLDYPVVLLESEPRGGRT